MKKSTAWTVWTINSILIIFSLVKMFLRTPYWIVYALVVGTGFYINTKIHKKYILK